MSTFTIRPFRYTDSYKVAKMHRRTIRKVNSKDYPPDAIKVWGDKPTGRGHWKSTTKYGEHKFVAVDQVTKDIIGFMGFNLTGEMFIYVSAKTQGQGVGKALMNFGFERLKKAGVPKAHLDASLTAVGFYEHLGFTKLEHAFHPMKGRDGTKAEIECWKMEKVL